MSALSGLYRNDTHVPFLKLWRPVLTVSALLIAVSILAVLFRGFNLGLDFEGGAAWEVADTDISTDDAREALRPLGVSDARIQTGGDVLRVRAELQADDAAVAQVSAALLEVTGATEDDLSLRVAGPSWGDEITSKARNALIVFFIVIAIYITLRLRWTMAVGALAAVVHDILITVGIYALFQLEITPPTVIAFLTIMGYSLYDTLVVFDKVRDNEHKLGGRTKMTYPQIMNQSLNQVLARSINTSITSILPVASVLIVGSFMLGAVTLREFSVALLIGIIAGTFSSIFVAAPIATWLWGDKEMETRELRLSGESRSKGSTGRGPVGVRGDTPVGREKQKAAGGTTATAIKGPKAAKAAKAEKAAKAAAAAADKDAGAGTASGASNKGSSGAGAAKKDIPARPSGEIAARPRKKKRKK